MKNIKQFYFDYKCNICDNQLPDKTFIKLYGNNFVQFAQLNLYTWEVIQRLIESFGFKHVEK